MKRSDKSDPCVTTTNKIVMVTAECVSLQLLLALYTANVLYPADILYNSRAFDSRLEPSENISNVCKNISGH